MSVTEKPVFDWTIDPATPRPTYAGASDPYLAKLRSVHHIDEVIVAASDDDSRLRLLTAWAHRRWPHDGWNEPSAPDPMTILDEASRGRSFRCVEYAVVLAAALSSVGIRARPLGLMTRDAETAEEGAGHVVVEAWLPDRRRWVLADSQCDAILSCDGEPLSALELLTALAESPAGITMDGCEFCEVFEYLGFVAPYLYFFAVPLTVRFDVPDPLRHGGRLMLVPRGSAPPSVFQRVWPMGEVTTTHSAASFYAEPAALDAAVPSAT